ncbi:nicotinate-nucleotide--dimethylbenzimidazole phosphoribosyltransferase [Bartonella sp. CB178]|uniref:nicotinate-nucleotide--dimethylbenzimidazole phosphoribosyltransferase n=1 Tax=Bartonella sp. CB178 TaxID=3112255 RepID=UPI00300DFC87
MAASPFDDFRALLTNLPVADEISIILAKKRQESLTRAGGALGKLGDIAVWYAGWRDAEKPPIVKRPLVAIFSGNHGIIDENITPFPQSMTQKMVKNSTAGGGVINQICQSYDLGLKIFDLALEYPTMNITKDAAMDEHGAAATMAFGMESIANGIDLLCIGEMGIGNATIASALCLALFGGEAEDWIGNYVESDEEFYRRKITAIKTAVSLHKQHFNDPFEIMRRLGGREVAAIIGAVLAARMEKVPVVLDGFVATAAAAVLYKMHPRSLDHTLIGHVSPDPAHRKLLKMIGKEPLLDLEINFCEGVGAAVAAGVVKAAVLTHAQTITFEEEDLII